MHTKSGGIDFDTLQVNNSSYNEGTVCVANECVKGWLFEHMCMNGHHKSCNGWIDILVMLVSSHVGVTELLCM